MKPPVNALLNAPLKFRWGLLALFMATSAAGAAEVATLNIDGVRLGMSKAEALAALKKANPSDKPVDIYAGYVAMHGLVMVPRQALRPADVDIFAALSVGPTAEALGCSPFRKSKAPLSNTTVLFTADLKAPQVAYIEKYTGHCGDNLPVKAAIGGLIDRFSADVARAENVDLTLRRISGEMPGNVALLEWRWGASGPLRNQMGTGREFTVSNIPSDLGNAKGGVVVHAHIESEPGNINYLKSTTLYLWDDVRMATYYQDQAAVLRQVNAMGYGVGDLDKPDVVARVMAAVAPAPAPDPSRTASAVGRSPAGRAPDAIVSLPAKVALHAVGMPQEVDIPGGVAWLDLSPKDAALLSKVSLSTPHVWLRFDPQQCLPSGGVASPWRVGAFPCGASIPVPLDALGSPADEPNAAGVMRKVYRSTRPFKTVHLQRTGFIDTGARLFKAEGISARPADRGYVWADDQPYTWFMLDPGDCRFGNETFDCSQPIALPNEDWKPAR